MRATPYEDINKILDELAQGLSTILGSNLVGFYLTGSLSYGDFNPESSDIDLLALVRKPVLPEELRLIKDLHFQIEASHAKWAERIECSYTPLVMLGNILPPKQPRPYIGEGRFYEEADYGNEWLINNYLLYQDGITLLGPDFRTLLPPVEIADVQKACIRDFSKEWQPKISDPAYLSNSHYQAYVVLNLCRILYTVRCAAAGSKKVSAAWVKEHAPQWKDLIEAAGMWKYGDVMDRQEETIRFIKYAAAATTSGS
jgi:predicted nucleotidyltransferase